MKMVQVLTICFLLQTSLAVVIVSEPRAISSAPFAFVQRGVQMLSGGASAAFEAFADAEADAEMDADLGLDLSVQVASRTAAEPATLAEYCAGPPPAAKLGEGTRVKADWKDYGTMYPGKVKEVNADGTVDIKYNDGFTEKNVDPDDVKARKKKALLQVAKPLNDPACKMQEFLKKIQDKIPEINEMISQWSSAQRAKMSAQEQPPSPPPSVTAPPAPEGPAGVAAPPAAATQDQTAELEKLKAQLADLDKYIKELEDQEAANDKKMQKLGPNAAPGPAPAVKTVDDLIAEYRAKIAQRENRVQELLQKLKQQQQELARLGESQISLKDIDDAVAQLEKDVAEGLRKRDELEKAGELDPELSHLIGEIVKSLSKLRSKLDNLIALEAKAKAEREKAEQEAAQDAEAAIKKAKLEGKDPDKAAAEAIAAAKKKNKEKAKKAELATMDAAHEVEKDLDEAGKGATKLDTGLHPHGEKWWRYRYEHSYIEAMLMIFISFLMLVWSEFWRHMRLYVKRHSLLPGAAPLTAWEELEQETHGTILILWMHYLADQMLVCIFVYLTVWIAAKTHLMDIFPMVVLPSDDMHVPHTAEEYRHIAVDMVTIFFFAQVFYFALMFAVAHEIRTMTSRLEEFHDQPSGFSSPGHSMKGLQAQVGKAAMGSMAGSAAIANTKKHFISKITKQMMVRDDPDLKELSKDLDDDFHNFPICKYLKANVRMTGIQLFLFSWTMWLPIMGLFFVLLLLHRFAHMGFVRIMGVSSILVLVLICSMAYFTKTFVKHVEDDYESDEDHEETVSLKKTFHEKYNSEAIFLSLLEFALFFVCYGISRMICQPWMWELHFWPVLCLTIVAILCAILFVVIVAPGIPSFLIVMALPPYVDSENIEMMKHCARSYSKESQGRAGGV